MGNVTSGLYKDNESPKRDPSDELFNWYGSRRSVRPRAQQGQSSMKNVPRSQPTAAGAIITGQAQVTSGRAGGQVLQPIAASTAQAQTSGNAGTQAPLPQVSTGGGQSPGTATTATGGEPSTKADAADSCLVKNVGAQTLPPNSQGLKRYLTIK
jgi:hypothetical protein